MNSRWTGFWAALRKLKGVIANRCCAVARMASIAAWARSRSSVVSAGSSKKSKKRSRSASAVGDSSTTNSLAELPAPGVKLDLEFFQDGLDGHRNARLVICLGRCLCASVERGLDAPESDGVSQGRFDEVGQGFALPEHGLELSAQLWLDADLGAAATAGMTQTAKSSGSSDCQCCTARVAHSTAATMAVPRAEGACQRATPQVAAAKRSSIAAPSNAGKPGASKTRQPCRRRVAS